MIPAISFNNCDVGVFGLARSGLAAIRSLREGGARVYAWDQREAANAAAQSEGATVVSFRNWPWDRIKALILSPGVPLTHPAPHEVVRAARDAGVEIIGDVDLFARELRPNPNRAGRAPIIAVTGTNGKSTTTALIGHVLSACGYTAEVGGNIGDGDDVAFVEAMKMEIPVASTAAGKIKTILVKLDDVVAEGQAIAIVET